MDKIDKLMRMQTIKRAVIITLVLLIAAPAAGLLIYIHIYDASKPVSFEPRINSTSVNFSLASLKPSDISGKSEISLPKKAEIAVEYSPAEFSEFTPSGGTLVCRLQNMEIRVQNWQYTKIGDLYGLLSKDAGNYFGYSYYYDFETAKKLPAYRYLLNLDVLKDGTFYQMHIFCKDPDELNMILNNAIPQINAKIK